MFKRRCCKTIQKLRQDFLLLLLCVLVIILIIFIGLAFCFNKINESSPTLIKVIFSSETLVAIVAGIAGIYSWRHSKSKIEYEKNLQMLKDIDEIREFYIDRQDELEIIKQCQLHIEDMRGKTENSSNKFLITYLEYVNSKFENDDSNDYGIESVVEDDCKEAIASMSISDIKTNIASKEKTSTSFVRYSKNYEVYPTTSVIKWKTWYTLRQNMLNDINDNDRIIFFTKVGVSYQGCEIVGKELKKLIEEVPVRNSKNGNLQYDLYINKSDSIFCEDKDGENINLSNYRVKELDLSYLKISSKI